MAKRRDTHDSDRPPSRADGSSRWTTLLLLAGTSTFAGACGPTGLSGDCTTTRPCPRGEFCNIDEAVCVPTDVDTSASLFPAPETFSTTVIPFFRGEVCTVPEVEAGASFPVHLRACLHPCVNVTSFRFKHSWECFGSSCSAFVVYWVEGSGDACPENAFGHFSASECEYAPPVEFEIAAVLNDGTPVEGQMELEVPFLTHDDASEIAGNAEDTNLIRTTYRQYPSDPDRIVLGRAIRLLRNGPTPPSSCGDDGSACECTQVGFASGD